MTPARRLKALLIDLSGTLHVGTKPTRDAARAIQRLRDAGILLRFCSNTSKESNASLLEKLHSMDLDVRPDELFTSLSAVKDIVVSQNLRPLYLLSSSALSDFPPSSPPYDSVVVGLAPDRLNYEAMNECFRLLSNENEIHDDLMAEHRVRKRVRLIATHKALYYRDVDQKLSIGPGPFISALTEASGVESEIVGKPSRSFFEVTLQSLEKDGLSEQDWSSVGMVGDDYRQDVPPVLQQLGLLGYLVRTGKYRSGDEDRAEDGSIHRVSDDLSSLVDFILSESPSSLCTSSAPL